MFIAEHGSRPLVPATILILGPHWNSFVTDEACKTCFYMKCSFILNNVVEYNLGMTVICVI